MCPGPSARKGKRREPRHLGKLPPLYDFILNPYRDARFTACPKCERKMRQRKLPLFIHVDPFYPIVVNYTCKYCPDCTLLIVHQDRIEELLIRMLIGHRKEELIGHDYMVMGTIDPSAWKMGEVTLQYTLDNLHDFANVLTVEPAHYGWVEDKKESPDRAKRDESGSKDIEK